MTILVTTTKHNPHSGSYDIQMDGEGFFALNGKSRSGRNLVEYVGYSAGSDQKFHRISPQVMSILEKMKDDKTGRQLSDYVKQG